MSQPTNADIMNAIRELAKEMSSMRLELAEIKGRITDMPTARDFGRLEGRVQEMSERLPTTIGYTPPRSAAG
jgi:hypothetical protein